MAEKRKETYTFICSETTSKGKIGYASVPLQKVEKIYDTPTAFTQGTLFPELNYPQGKYGPLECFYADCAKK